jgi:hypothetical protein
MNAATSRVESSVQVFSYSQNNKFNCYAQLEHFLLLLSFALLCVIALGMIPSAVMLRVIIGLDCLLNKDFGQFRAHRCLKQDPVIGTMTLTIMTLSFVSFC